MCDILLWYLYRRLCDHDCVSIKKRLSSSTTVNYALIVWGATFPGAKVKSPLLPWDENKFTIKASLNNRARLRDWSITWVTFRGGVVSVSHTDVVERHHPPSKNFPPDWTIQIASNSFIKLKNFSFSCFKWVVVRVKRSAWMLIGVLIASIIQKGVVK